MAAVVLEERIDNIRASYLLDTLTFDQFYSAWEGNKTDAKKQYEKIIKYLNGKVSSSINYVKYNYSKKRKDGRLIGECSIQTCNKNIRGFICNGLTTDIDMVNAHPVILYTLCNYYDIECPNLTLYVKDRKKCLVQIMEKDDIKYNLAKKKVLISTNLDKRIKSNSDFLNNYDVEMKKIHKKFLDIPEYQYVKEFAKFDNFEGSFINHILCINENNILETIRTYCDNNKINIHSLMFDGLMVYGDINDFTLKSIEKYINEKTIFTEMKLSIKEHETTFELPKNYIPKRRITYEDVKKQFESENCKVGAEFICEKHNELYVYSRTAFSTLHEELKYINDKGEEKEFITDWFKDSEKRKYDKYDTIPKDSMCPSYVYNMWIKLPVEIIPSLESNDYLDKSLNWFKNHIKLLCDYNQIHYDFIIMWLAQMFQYPENKSMQLIFIGEEGAGKGTFVKFLATMLGGLDRCYNTADPQEDIFGKFNDPMKRAFLVVLNESDKSGIYNNNNKMKDLITEPTIVIRPKGEKAFTMRSVHRFMAFSNNPDPNIKNKRRDFTMKISNDRIDDDEYFTEGNLYAKDINCCKYIYDWLMVQDTKPVINKNDIPVGEYDEMLKEAQKDPINEFIEEMTYIHSKEEEPKMFSANALYELYLDFCKRNHINYCQGKESFTTKLYFKAIKGISKLVKKVSGKATRVYMIDFKLVKKTLDLKEYEEVQVDDDGYMTD